MYADIIDTLDIKTKYDDVKSFRIDAESQFCIECNDGTNEQLFPVMESLFKHEFSDLVWRVTDRLAIISGVPRIYDQVIHDLVIKTPREQVRQIFFDETSVKLRLKDETTETLFEITQPFTPIHWQFVIRQISRKFGVVGSR